MNNTFPVGISYSIIMGLAICSYIVGPTEKDLLGIIVALLCYSIGPFLIGIGIEEVN